MEHASLLQAILSADLLRQRALRSVHSLGLPDCWIGAGFIRNAVWDHLHGRPPSRHAGDIDVLWFDSARIEPSHDRNLEATLRTSEPSLIWSVKNQARMHQRNGDAPYASAADAMRCWPETATAVAVRLADLDSYEIAAPFGLDDLVNLVLRPTPRFAETRRQTFLDRIRTKRWLEIWPLLRMEAGPISMIPFGSPKRSVH